MVNINPLTSQLIFWMTSWLVKIAIAHVHFYHSHLTNLIQSRMPSQIQPVRAHFQGNPVIIWPWASCSPSGQSFLILLPHLACVGAETGGSGLQREVWPVAPFCVTLPAITSSWLTLSGFLSAWESVCVHWCSLQLVELLSISVLMQRIDHDLSISLSKNSWVWLGLGLVASLSYPTPNSYTSIKAVK